MAEEHREIDAVTGTATTGHEWDGLRELNTPLPRWWLWLFYVTIVWAVGYWIVYPAWPLLTNSTQGVFGYHSRNAVVEDLNALHAQRGPMMAKLAARYPAYGWERNAGYATLEHRSAIREHGLTPFHRRSFPALQALIAGDQATLDDLLEPLDTVPDVAEPAEALATLAPALAG